MQDNNESGESNLYYNSNNLLFKSKYKFIEFKPKGTNEKNYSELINNEPLLSEEIQSFYTDLIDNETQYQNQEKIILGEKELKIEPTTAKKLIHKTLITPKMYLKAAQDWNQLKTIKDFLETNPSGLNETDLYGWNSLMIAIAAKNNEVVAYLLKNQSNNELFNECLSCKDAAGNDPKSIAIKVDNKEALNLIRNINVKEIEDLEVFKSHLVNSPEINDYCEICKINYNNSEHLSSISHLLNENSTKKPNDLSYNYHLRSNNKGYQLLCKSGWEHKRGLGKSEQGIVFPVQATQKLDRRGIGIEKDESKKSLFIVNKKSVGIEKAPRLNESNYRIESDLNNRKDAIKNEKKRRKERVKERNLRDYFNR